MAAIMLVTMALLVSYTLALTPTELSQFTARQHTEKNSNTQGTVTITTDSKNHHLVSNGVPDHDTGTFPGSGNPNNLTSQNHVAKFPVSPKVRNKPTCLPMGIVGYTKNGVPLFNPFNSKGENAVEGDTAEKFDLCDGHPNKKGIYHYHQGPGCVYDGGMDELVGVALDGFPIYGPVDSTGKNLTNADLDECHGRDDDGEYRYRLTAQFPYIMACFRGNPKGIRPKKRLRKAKGCKVITF